MYGHWLEILHRYIAIGQRARGLAIFDNFHRVLLGRVLPIDDADVLRARALADQLPGLPARDLLHLAVITRHQLRDIITADAHDDGLPAVRRVDPASY